MFCKKCGNSIKSGEKFCRKCGTPMSALSKDTDIASEPVSQKRKEEKKGNNKVLMIAASAAILILTGAMVFGGILLLRGTGIIASNIETEESETEEVTKYQRQTESNLVTEKETLVETQPKTEKQTQAETKLVKDRQVQSESKQGKKNQNHPDTKSAIEVQEETQVQTQAQTQVQSESEIPAEPEIIHDYYLVTGEYTWEEANEYCKEHEGYLATITSKEEQETVEKTLAPADKLHVIWLGANDLNTSDEYEWLTGETFAYSQWAEGEPNNEDDVEHYLVMYEVDDKWVWNDAPNDIEKYYKGKMGFLMEKESLRG